MISTAQKVLKQYFGYDKFRPLQEEIISTVLSRQDSLVLMPTGGGKSLCFQIPALLMEGLCIVVSPLISLMKDQVEALRGNGISAAFLNSSLTPDQEVEIFEQCRSGEIKLLYVSPERIIAGFERIFGFLKISMVAIDEAHCISSWGHDFRPEYTQLARIKKTFPMLPVIALTATADKVTRNDIINQLNLTSPKQFIASFDRPNLSLDVRPGYSAKAKHLEIIQFINEHEGESGIIYCLSRKNTEKLAAVLQDAGIDAAYYHAGMHADKRNLAQENFINDRTQVICATIAFGMGIDKSNVRWVMHYNLPKNIEGYYQEIGRAGRDGLPSQTILYFNLGDIVMLRQFAGDSGQAQLNLEKLTRMQQFAEADICRRKILLAYFGEVLEEDCGNCDVCKNPPKRFDGTIIAQKAMSAMIRMNEEVGTNMLIDVLRGSAKHELIEKGYHQIKTYGAGRDINFSDWQQYILQLLNLGLIEMAYDQNFALKVTEAGKQVIFKGKKVDLVKLASEEQRKERLKVKPKKEQIIRSPSEELFIELKKLRKSIADEENIPAYIVFNDATLKEMAFDKPVTELDFLTISGVGQHKFERYGEEFMECIREFKKRQNRKLTGSTYLDTAELLKKGHSIEEIAAIRGIQPTTVYSHLAHLYEKGEAIDLFRFVSRDEIYTIKDAVEATGEKEKLRPIFDQLEGKIEFFKIRLALSYLTREGKI